MSTKGSVQPDGPLCTVRTYIRVKFIVGADDLPLDWGREDEEEDDAEHADRGHRPPSRQSPQPPDPLRDRAGEYIQLQFSFVRLQIQL